MTSIGGHLVDPDKDNTMSRFEHVFWALGTSVRTNLANRPTEPMLVPCIAQYTKLSGNCGTRQSGSGQTTPVYVGVTCGSRRSIVWVENIERLR